MHAVIYAVIGVLIILVLGPVSSPKYPSCPVFGAIRESACFASVLPVSLASKS
jgi:hypothetical protein